MASVPKTATISEYSTFVNTVYGIPNDRHYTSLDMLNNIQRFSMRAIKGIRKNSDEKVKVNILIAFSWYTSLMNRFHIDIADAVWDRFPYLCSYCGERPCACKSEKVESRRKITKDESVRPRTMEEYQQMFREIYPPERRTRQDAAIHLAEEVGELSEAFNLYMSDRSGELFQEVKFEAADFYSCIMGLLNSLDINFAEEVSEVFTDNCHVCHNAPCTCTFESVSTYDS
jgi:NTP pyrophosphatase (non-canonical NTP hydrolase)